jgi:hypothetical protein
MPLLDAPAKHLNMFLSDEVPIRKNAFRGGSHVVDENWFKIYLWDFLYYQEKLPKTQSLPDGFDLLQAHQKTIPASGQHRVQGHRPPTF